MLDVPTAFPQVGSYALYALDGETCLVRIQQRGLGPDAVALISFSATTGASGSKTVPLADLIDGTPLTDAERAEYRTLTTRRLRVKRFRGPPAARYNALRSRNVHSRILAEKMRDFGLRPIMSIAA